MASNPQAPKEPRGLRKITKALVSTISIVLGVLGVVYGAWYIWMIPRRGISCLYFPGEILVISLPCAVGAIVMGHSTRCRLGYGSGYVCAILALVSFFVPRVPDYSRNAASAVGSLRTINTAEFTYTTTYSNGYSPTLRSLGPPAEETNPSAGAAWLIDSVLAGGEKWGYRFVYSPGPRDEKGRITSYTLTASPIQPGVTGTNHYYTDQTGVIREDSKAPASAADLPIPG